MKSESQKAIASMNKNLPLSKPILTELFPPLKGTLSPKFFSPYMKDITFLNIYRNDQVLFSDTLYLVMCDLK